MAKQKRSSFRGKVARNAEKQKKEASFNFLVLPKGYEEYTPDYGSIRLDFLPYVVKSESHPDRDDEFGTAVPGELWYRRPYKIHRNIGVDNEAVICLQSIGEKCPICEELAKMKAAKADKENLKALKTSSRNLYLVIPIDTKKWDEDPHFFDISQYAFQDLLNDELEDDAEYEIFPDPEEGKTLRVRFEKDTFSGQSFPAASRIDFREREHMYEEDFIDDLPDLDVIIEKSVLSYKELQQKFMAFDDSDDNGEEFDDEADEKPVRKRKARTVRKPKEEPEEEKEDQDEQDDEPEKKPRTRRSRAAKKDDEEPEKKPRTRRTSSRKPAKDKCPYDHEFGVDTDDFDECEDCKLWDSCNEAKKNNE